MAAGLKVEVPEVLVAKVDAVYMVTIIVQIAIIMKQQVLCTYNHSDNGGLPNYVLAGGLWNGAWNQATDSGGAAYVRRCGMFQIFYRPGDSSYYATSSLRK